MTTTTTARTGVSASLANRMFTELAQQNGLHGWRLVFDTARNRAGQTRPATRTISLSRHFLALNTAERVQSTILHEIAHALVGCQHGHDAVWKAKCREIGGDARTYYDPNTTNRVPSKYIGRCITDPAHTFEAHRMTRQMQAGSRACRKCHVPGTDRGRIVWRIR